MSMSKFAVEVLAETEVSAKEAHPSSGVDFNVYGAITRRKMEKETRRHVYVSAKMDGVFAGCNPISSVVCEFEFGAPR